MNRDLTTTETAELCAVSNATVNRWIASGLLAGYRIPGSTFRRIPRAALGEFLHRHGLPTERFKARFPELVLDEAS